MENKTNETIWAHAALFLVNTLYGASHVLAKGVMPTYLTPSVFIFFVYWEQHFCFGYFYFSLNHIKLNGKIG